jgi:hypothetical protein
MPHIPTARRRRATLSVRRASSLNADQLWKCARLLIAATPLARTCWISPGPIKKKGGRNHAV